MLRKLPFADDSFMELRQCNSLQLDKVTAPEHNPRLWAHLPVALVLEGENFPSPAR